MEQNGVKINLDSAGTKIQLYILQLYIIYYLAVKQLTFGHFCRY